MTNTSQRLTNEVLSLNSDGTITLPSNIRLKAIGDILYVSEYAARIQASFGSGGQSGTFEAVAPNGRANGIVQGHAIVPKGIKGHGDGDEVTIILKDNHGPGGNNNKQYKVKIEYKNGGRVNGVELCREHKHPNVENVKNVKYENQPQFEAGGKLEFIGTYQDTNDGGVRLRMFYKNESGIWVRLFDHVDYGDNKGEGRPYRGKSGVQDGTRTDGGVNGYIPDHDDVEEYKHKCKGKKMSEVELTDRLRNIFSKLGTSVIYAREIDKDTSDLHDGIDDPLSFGEK